MQCPDDGVPLSADAAATTFGCGRCGGALVTGEALEALAPKFMAALAPETNERSPAFRRLRACPQCRATMAPCRFGPEGAWLERCAACELFWADAADRRLLAMVGRQAAREAAYMSLPAEDRRTLARDLAETVEAEEGGPEPSRLQFLLALVGVPQLEGIEREREPLATWGIGAVLVLVYVAGLVWPGTFGASALAYEGGRGEWFDAFTSAWVHAGFLHLLGNIAFFAAFGDGLEQRLPRVGYAILFAFAGMFTAFAQGLDSPGVPIVGASGAIACVLGAAVVLQPRARVLTRVVWVPVRVPILLYGAGELAFQAVMMVGGSQGIAWVSHVSGLVLGLVVGFAIRRSREMVPDEAAAMPTPVRVVKPPAGNGTAKSPWR